VSDGRDTQREIDRRVALLTLLEVCDGLREDDRQRLLVTVARYYGLRIVLPEENLLRDKGP